MNIKISASQLFAAIVLVPAGSALFFLITPEAKQDAWLVMFIYMFFGILFQIIYTSLWKKYPQDNIVTYMPKIFGKILGYSLSVLYTILFAYEASRVLRDIIELTLTTAMTMLSSYIIAILLMSVIGYAAFLGLENLCRLTYIFFWLMLAFFILEWIFISTTPNALKFYNLKPVLESGIIDITKKGWQLMGFPYGETALFTMFYPYVVEKSRVRKAAVLAIISEGILLSLNTILFISVLGVDYASTSLFPLLQTLKLMHAGSTFDRMDIFVLLILVIVAFIKISYFMFGAMLGTAQLMKLRDTKNLALPFSILVLVASMLIAKNYPQHIYIGLSFTITYIHIPLLVIIPAIALLFYYLKIIIKRINLD
ncbi:MAG: GerAB/ArcD/ProY family transporter [Bacillota bacterium]|nr:GerAB/ArcD/ProY family transporter [Bacillota bacterium]